MKFEIPDPKTHLSHGEDEEDDGQVYAAIDIHSGQVVDKMISRLGKPTITPHKGRDVEWFIVDKN